MLIRSQDKKIVLNIDQIVIFVRDNCILCDGYVISPGGTNLLGEYSSEEKAIKVLDMIQEKYLSYMEVTGRLSLTGDSIIQPNMWVLPKVFQMPQDDEV